MDAFIKLHHGYWWLKSKIDPRFNNFGSGLVSLFHLPEQAYKFIKKCEKKYKTKKPDDLEFGYIRMD